MIAAVFLAAVSSSAVSSRIIALNPALRAQLAAAYSLGTIQMSGKLRYFSA